MRARKVEIAALAVGLAVSAVPSSAFATGGVGGRGETGGKGGLGPSSPGGSDVSSASGDTGATTDTLQQPLGGAYRDVTERPPAERPWEVVADFETHRLLQENYLAEGVGKVQTFNVLDLAGYYFITPDDRIRLEGVAFQYFLADTGESGLRMDDAELEYSHVFHLPGELALRASLGVTAPLAFDSQLASNITSPFAKLKLLRIFGDLTVAFGLSARDYIDRYSSSASLGVDAAGNPAGGQPNLNWRFGGSLAAEYDLPFFRPISLGVSVADFYLLYYGVGSCPYDTMCYGATSDAQFGSSQPVQQSYGEDVYVRYVLPDLSDFHSNIVLTLANGDPTLGYPSVLNDGMQHPYFLYYDTAEVYLALEGSY